MADLAIKGTSVGIVWKAIDGIKKSIESGTLYEDIKKEKENKTEFEYVHISEIGRAQLTLLYSIVPISDTLDFRPTTYFSFGKQHVDKVSKEIIEYLDVIQALLPKI